MTAARDALRRRFESASTDALTPPAATEPALGALRAAETGRQEPPAMRRSRKTPVAVATVGRITGAG